MTKLVLLLIRSYRLAAPHLRAMLLLPTACQFVPSCSEYVEESIRRFGVLRGTKLGIARILRCHPGHPGGVDLPLSRG